MSRTRTRRALVLALAATLPTTAVAQPGAATPPAQPAPESAAPAPSAPAQPAPTQLVRLQLDDGRAVDGYITGGDAASYFVQTNYGYFAVPIAKVVSVTPLVVAPGGTPAPLPPPPLAYTPASGYTPVAVPAVDATPTRTRDARAGGFVMFGTFYLITAIAASAQLDDDDTAKLGFIPVLGPMLWALRDDEDDGGEDGWDYLAGADAFLQGFAIIIAIANPQKRKSSSSNAMVRPVTARDYAGLAISGRW